MPVLLCLCLTSIFRPIELCNDNKSQRYSISRYIKWQWWVLIGGYAVTWPTTCIVTIVINQGVHNGKIGQVNTYYSYYTLPFFFYNFQFSSLKRKNHSPNTRNVCTYFSVFFTLITDRVMTINNYKISETFGKIL